LGLLGIFGWLPCCKLTFGLINFIVDVFFTTTSYLDYSP
jgi:hypothetical protein